MIFQGKVLVGWLGSKVIEKASGRTVPRGLPPESRQGHKTFPRDLLLAARLCFVLSMMFLIFQISVVFLNIFLYKLLS